VHVIPAFVNAGVTVTVAMIADPPAFTAVNDGIVVVLELLERPIEVVLLLQV